MLQDTLFLLSLYICMNKSILQRLKKSKKFAFRNSPFTIQNNGLSFLFDRKLTCMGDVVIVKKDLTSRAYWKLAKMEELIRGAEGRVRAATVNVLRDSKKSVRLRRVIQHLVPIEVRSEPEQADMSIIKKNNPVVNNVRDNVDTRPRRDAARNAGMLRRLRSHF